MAGGSEIDDIFANKKRSKPTSNSSRLGDSGKSSSSSSKNGKAKAKVLQNDQSNIAASNKQKQKQKQEKQQNHTNKHASEPLTILDPSQAIQRSKAEGLKSTKQKQKKAIAALTEEEKEFRDTRGTSRKRTEDGLAIYTEAELGMSNKGGDTPLCPFDCDCCF